ncbi:hypothetical protein HK099_004330 [Clydaea vesicula]|uniref:RGS domain-containing protein n=1 Tax=Clydaea vesicula TaxID=447962 RepID=A0AAD5Y318_9FUNG|nr:hypothetical protein HK099_004330 [Clydaea vesicula]
MSGEELLVVANTNLELQELVSQIEAEYLIRLKNLTSNEEQNCKIGNLFNTKLELLDLKERVGSCLTFNDQLIVEFKKEFSVVSQFLGEQILQPRYSEEATKKHNSENNSNLNDFNENEEKLIKILNSFSLCYFALFCIKDYTIEHLLFWYLSEMFAKDITEESNLWKVAQYIYLLFIKQGCPLKINLSSEVEKIIQSKLESSNDSNWSENLFTNAQTEIFQFLKENTFTKFEKNNKIRQAMEADLLKDSHTVEKLTWDIAKIDDTVKKLVIHWHSTKKNDTKDLEFKEMILKDTVKLYFGDIYANDYFDVNKRVSFGTKQVMASKEKRIKKFFGENMIPQAANNVNGNPLVLNGNQMTQEINDNFLDIEEKVESFNKTDLPSNSSIDIKKKKLKKITDIFGEHIPSTELVVQKLINEPEADSENSNSSLQTEGTGKTKEKSNSKLKKNLMNGGVDSADEKIIEAILTNLHKENVGSSCNNYQKPNISPVEDISPLGRNKPVQHKKLSQLFGEQTTSAILILEQQLKETGKANHSQPVNKKTEELVEGTSKEATAVVEIEQSLKNSSPEGPCQLESNREVEKHSNNSIHEIRKDVEVKFDANQNSKLIMESEGLYNDLIKNISVVVNSTNTQNSNGITSTAKISNFSCNGHVTNSKTVEMDDTTKPKRISLTNLETLLEKLNSSKMNESKRKENVTTVLQELSSAVVETNTGCLPKETSEKIKNMEAMLATLSTNIKGVADMSSVNLTVHNTTQPGITKPSLHESLVKATSSAVTNEGKNNSKNNLTIFNNSLLELDLELERVKAISVPSKSKEGSQSDNEKILSSNRINEKLQAFERFEQNASRKIFASGTTTNNVK